MLLTGLTTEELQEWARERRLGAYRGRQLADWVYRRSARSFDVMTDLPQKLRGELASSFIHPVLQEEDRSTSPDGAIKFLARARDGERVECVFLPYDDRISLCVSTQVGCAMDCSFCATGIGGLKRDLAPGEIVDQLLLVQAATGQRITHVVYMGMGEPLANYAATVASIRLLSKEVGLSARRITVSTVGLPAAIRRLATERLPITLAVSIHAPDDDVRRVIMPAARLHPLEDLLDACRHWCAVTRRRMTFEYLLLEGINDSPAQARDLARRIRGILGNVNLIPYNHVEGRGKFRRPSRERIEAFRAALEESGIRTTERMRRGNPVSAACGQLRHEAESGRKLFAPSGAAGVKIPVSAKVPAPDAGDG
jgi:23S rRNA (adenine2503-C2)-methyltransferase